MFILYDLVFLTFALIYLPLYLFRKKFHPGFISRLGILPQSLELGRPIWLHAVSVGEAIAMKGLIEGLRNVYPDKRLVISTVTATGNKIAKNSATAKDFVTYLPLDFSFIVRKVINKINPSIFIIAETELWPNLISYLNKKNIPIIVVNGRISDSSFRGYCCIKLLLRPILNKVNLFCVQTSSDLERLVLLGVSKEKIRVTGNMKFDITDSTPACRQAGILKKDYTDYRLKLGLKPEEKLLVAGSTHPGEEEIVLNVYKNLLGEFPYLRLLIAPRHPERSKEVERLVSRSGFKSVFVSVLQRTTHNAQRTTVFILDTIGQLISFYAIAEIVFVGGSLIKKGGHNILEPAFLGKPILFGPYMFNFRDIARLFLKNQAAISVHHQQELKEKIKYLLHNPAETAALSQRAKELTLQNQGATGKNLACLKEWLK